MHRRRLFLSFLAVLFSISSAIAQDARKPAPPNVVLIVSDDQAWTDYGFMGHPHIQTPSLDRLARASLVFRRGYVTSSLCCPSLASLITGKYPHQHKIANNDPPGGQTDKAVFAAGRETMSRFMDAQPTLPRLLTQAGYLTLQTDRAAEPQCGTTLRVVNRDAERRATILQKKHHLRR